VRIYDAAGRLKIAALWAAISGVPARVKEIEVLVDPNALQYVGWNDVTNQLELLTFDALDIPYDNSGSGLAATDVQAAIDEAVAAASPNLFAGWVSSTGTTGTSRLPAGWTVTRPFTGIYTVTHSLALSNTNGLSVAASIIATGGQANIQVRDTLTVNSFQTETIFADVALNRGWFFVAVINE
jgi:hypothetical protein